jgi:type I restriction enzyme S subunit
VSASATSNWGKARLGELLTVIRGVSYKKEDASSEPAPGRVPILRATNIQNGLVFEDFVYVPRQRVSDVQLLRKGDIVVAASSGSRNIVGKAAPLTTDWFGSFGTFCFGLRPKPGIDPGYLAWFLQTSEYRHQVSELAAGVNINNLRSTHIEEIPIAVAPPSEQRRIVAEIEKQFTRLDAGVAALRRMQVSLKRYRSAVLKAAYEGRLVPTEAELAKVENRKFEMGEELLARILAERRQNWKSRGKFKEPTVPDPLADMELPGGWVWTGFEQLADGTKNAIKAGPFGSALKKSFYTPSGFKIYGQEQVIKGDPYFGDYFISRDLFEKLQSCEVKPGDILVSLVGTTGKILILPPDCAPGIINPRLLKLSLNRAGVNPKFIKILLESATTRAFFKLAAHGGTMEILNLGILKTLPIALPPVAEQTRIVAEVERRLSVVEELEDMVSANLQRAIRLRQAVLARAFAG